MLRKKAPESPRRRQIQPGVVREPASRDVERNIFQRNRTLTGSTSNRLSHTHHPTDLQSPRTNAHQLAIKRRKISGILLTVLAAGIVIMWLLLQFTARVGISVSDTSLSRPIDNARYEKAINDYLAINPVSRLRFVLDQTSLTNYLSATLPEVARVSRVSLGAIGETNYTLTMRRPVAGWTINSGQYFVDAKGVAFQQNYYSSPTVQIIDDSGVDLQQGATVASNRFLGFVGRIVAISSESNYDVTEAIIPPGTTRQLEIRLQDVVPRVRLSIDRPAGEQVEDMTRALGYLTARGIAPEYIDVRVSGKAFYK